MREAVVIVIEREGRYLFVRRAASQRFAGWWSPITGGVEPGEAHEDTVVREAWEEMRARVRPLRKVWECPAAGGAFTLHWYLAELLSDEGLTPDPAEVSEFLWRSPAEFLYMDPLFDAHREFFQSILPTLKQ